MQRKLHALLAAGLAAAIAAPVLAGPPSYSPVPLGTLGGNGSYANGINASGEVTGFSSLTRATPTNPNPAAEWHAYRYSAGVMHDLGTAGGPFSTGTAINDAGEIAGFSAVVVGGRPQQHAVLFAAGALQDLGTLGGSGSQGRARTSTAPIPESARYDGPRRACAHVVLRLDPGGIRRRKRQHVLAEVGPPHLRCRRICGAAAIAAAIPRPRSRHAV